MFGPSPFRLCWGAPPFWGAESFAALRAPRLRAIIVPSAAGLQFWTVTSYGDAHSRTLHRYPHSESLTKSPRRLPLHTYDRHAAPTLFLHDAVYGSAFPYWKAAMFHASWQCTCALPGVPHTSAWREPACERRNKLQSGSAAPPNEMLMLCAFHCRLGSRLYRSPTFQGSLPTWPFSLSDFLFSLTSVYVIF